MFTHWIKSSLTCQTFKANPPNLAQRGKVWSAWSQHQVSSCMIWPFCTRRDIYKATTLSQHRIRQPIEATLRNLKVQQLQTQTRSLVLMAQ